MNKLFKQNNIILCLLIVILFICIYYFINRNNIENYQEGPTQAPTTTGAATNSDLSNTNGYVKFTTYNDYIKDTNNINIVFNYKYLQTLTDFFTNNNDVNIIINNITYPITYSDSGNGIIYNANDINTNTVYEGILKIKTPTTGGGTTPTTGGGTTPTTGGGTTPTTGAATGATTGAAKTTTGTNATTTGVSATTTIPKTTQKSITNNYDDYNIGMMLKGSNNTKNLNDFIAKNTLLGNNIYISPMNQLGVGSDNNEDDIFHKNKHKKIIDSTFTPMIQLG